MPELVDEHLRRRNDPVRADVWRKVILIRHGATPLNHIDPTRDLLRGWNDLPLSEEGMAEAQAIAESRIDFDALFSSDLVRAEQTADIIADYRLIPSFVRNDGFRPWNIGELAGKPAIHAAPILGQFADLTPLKMVPGGESFDTFRRRFLSALHDTITEYGGILAIVTHHRCIQLVKALQSYNWRLDGSIDQDVFTQKGEATGHVYEVEIPVIRLNAILTGPELAAL